MQSTREILEAFLRGDGEAEARLFLAHHDWLLARARRGRVRRCLPRQVDAEDVVQEVWLRVCADSCVASFHDSGPGSFRRYLAGVLANVASEWARRARTLKRGERATRRLPPDDAPRAPRDPAPTPTGAARADELRRTIERVLDTRAWKIFQLREIQQCTAVEAGRRLSLPDGLVRRVSKEAKDRLRRVLDPSGSRDALGHQDRP